MNQEQNNLNPNNFNTQGNNGIPNNQSLNNQSFNQGMSINQQSINPQPQPTPSFQQPINQMNIEQPIPQSMNSFESVNANNQSFNSKPSNKKNVGLIIGIVFVVAVVLVGIIFGSKLLANGKNNDDKISNNTSNIDDNLDNANEIQKKGKTDYYLYGGSDYDYFNSVIPTADGGYIAVGSIESRDIEGITKKGYDDKDAIIVKYNSNNEIVWQKNYGDKYADAYYDVIETNNKEYIAVGYKTEPKKYYRSAVIVKYDSKGNIVFEKEFGGKKGSISIIEECFRTISLDADGSYVVAGSMAGYKLDGLSHIGGYDAIIMKYNSNDEIIWQKNYGGSSNDVFNDIKILSDGNIIAVGSTYSQDISGLETDINEKSYTNSILIKYDKNGNLLWQKNYGGSLDDWFFAVDSTNDNGFIVSGYTYSKNIEGISNNGDFVALIVKFNNLGEVEWQKGLGEKWGNVFNSVATYKNDYIAVGYVTGYSEDNVKVNNIDQNSIIAIYNNNGELIEKSFYGGSNQDELNNIAISKNGYLIAGVYADEEPYKTIREGLIIKYEEEKLKTTSSNNIFIFLIIAGIIIFAGLYFIIKSKKKKI